MTSWTPVVTLASLTLAATAALMPLTAAANVAPASHGGQLVPIKPQIGGAQITDGRVMAGEHIGSRIIYGGTFTTIKLPNGTTVNQPYLAAFNADTGAFDPGFRPAVNGAVHAIEAGETASSFFIGGKFSTVNRASHKNLAKLSATNGAPLKWAVNTSGMVKTMDRYGDRLFVGGNFTGIGGYKRSKLAEVSASRGQLNPNFQMDVTGSRSAGVRPDGFYQNYSGPTVRMVRVTPDGQKLVVAHRGDQVGGQTRWGAAVINIGSTKPALTMWRTHLWDAQPGKPLDYVGIFEGELSPDGRYFVLTLGQGNFAPLHDTVVAFSVAGRDNVQPLWVTQLLDSAFGITVSGAAVYVGGHFCWVESSAAQVAPMYWPGADGNEYSCKVLSGSRWAPAMSYHYHLAALQPSTGRAIDTWTAESTNSRNGVVFLRAVDNGLLLGHDGTKVTGEVTGHSAFFKLGSGPQTGPVNPGPVNPGPGPTKKPGDRS